MSPTVGRIVIFKTRLASLKFGKANQEIADHPAIITRVHDETTCDMTVFFTGSAPGPKNVVTNDASGHSWWEFSPKE